MSQHWHVLGSRALCEESLCNRNSGFGSGGSSCPTASQGELCFRRIHIPGGKETPCPCGFIPAVPGGGLSRPQQLMLAGLSLAPCARRSVSVPASSVSLCAISHTCCPHSCAQGPAGSRHCRVIPVGIWFCAEQALPTPAPPNLPFPSSLSLQHQKVKYTEVVCD